MKIFDSFLCIMLPLKLLLLVAPVAVVDGAASIMQCNGTCVVSYEATCPEVVAEYDFQGDCCALADSEDGEGCVLTVGAGPGYCAQSGRITPCSGEENPWEYFCVGASQLSFEAGVMDEETPECIASDYDLFNTSNYDIMSPQTITLSGLSSLTPEEALELQELMANHTLEFETDLDVDDLQTYVAIFIGEEAIVSEVENELEVAFFQYLTWRSDDEMINGTTILTEVYQSRNGREAFLERLQDSDTFAEVVDVSELGLPPPPPETTAPTEETDVGDVPNVTSDGTEDESEIDSNAVESTGTESAAAFWYVPGTLQIFALVAATMACGLGG